MDRDQHLAWAKARALEFLDRGELKEALASMVSDMDKHDNILRSSVAVMSKVGATHIERGDAAGLRAWIKRFY